MSRDIDIEVHHESRPEDEAAFRRSLDRYDRSAGPFDEIQPLMDEPALRADPTA